VEVLLLTDRVDEWMLSFLTEFEGKELVSVAKGGLDLGAGRRSGEEGTRRNRNSYKDLVAKMKDALATRPRTCA
jgi:molecular chaperone HtpG